LNWKHFFDRIGMNGTRWQWRIHRWENLFKRGGFRQLGEGISVTRIIIFVNVVLFTIMILWGMLAGVGSRALLNPPTRLLLVFGGQLWQPLVMQYDQWWRCITYAFTHGGLIHLAFNMVVLFQVGPLVEVEIGKSRFIFLYVFTALTATVLGYFWHPFIPVVGASGSLFGLIGFAAVYYHRLGDSSSMQRRNFMLQWAVFAFIFGLFVGADNAGHLGGALGGALVGLIMPIRGQLLRQTNSLFNFLGGLSTAAVIISLGLLAVSWFA